MREEGGREGEREGRREWEREGLLISSHDVKLTSVSTPFLLSWTGDLLESSPVFALSLRAERVELRSLSRRSLTTAASMAGG